MELMLLRHSMTAGNERRAYIGRTDEPLSERGRALAQERAGALPRAEKVFVSPLKRCRETAALLFPGMEQIVLDGLRETDFGRFEGKNYDELKDDADYIAWLDSGGTIAFPGGEDRETVRARTLAAFAGLLTELPASGTAAMVAHGGTLMTILSELAQPHRDYYDWQVQNCRGYLVTPNGGWLQVISEL